jgi:hypothetical protein
MRPKLNLLWAFLLLAIGLTTVQAADYDGEYDYDVRVARISLLRGDVQIRRAGNKDWERASLNLALVEGDQLATGENSRFEIQLEADNYLRVAENSAVEIVTLRDEGVALSLPEGTLTIRLANFDKNKKYLEIDAPKTTVSIEKEGYYRIDALRDNRDNEVRIMAADGGQARVYSDNAGFTVRNGRTARLFLDGDNAGEWEMVAASRFTDEFDGWNQERDYQLAKRRRYEYRERYYDSDIYGVDDLNDYGEWIYAGGYGYVWRPYRNSISSYSNWSPYRYGYWRWTPYYGWTWVPDEPWGWATHHYGRWIYYGGNWCWMPRGYAGYRRGRWHPALVIFINFGRNLCWYPTPYNYGYRYRYYRYVDRRRYTIINNNTTIINNNPSNISPKRERDFVKPKSFDPAYQTAITGVPLDEFGKGRAGYQFPNQVDSKRIVDLNPFDDRLPEPKVRANSEIKVEREVRVAQTRLREDKQNSPDILDTGATKRQPGLKLEEKLEKESVYNNRQPIIRTERTERTDNNSERETKRNTGAVERERNPVIRPNTTDETKRTERTTVTIPERNTTRDDDSKKEERDTEIRRPRPEPKPEYRPEPRPEPKPEIRPEPRREPKPEYRPEPRPEPRPEIRPEPRPEPKPERRPEPKPEVRPEPKPEKKPDNPKIERSEDNRKDN